MQFNLGNCGKTSSYVTNNASKANYTGWIIKTSQIVCLRKDTCSKPRQNCFGDWIEHCLHYTYLSHQWRITQHVTEKYWMNKAQIKNWLFTKRLYHSRSRFSKKLTVSVGVSWSWNFEKQISFFINPQKTKVDQNCYTDLLKTSLLPECRRHYPGS